MNRLLQLVVFKLDEHSYALHLNRTRNILRMVWITPLPKAPEIVLGIINVQGSIIPVFDIRKRFGLPERETGLEDRLIIAQTSRRTVALAADVVVGVAERSAGEVVAAQEILPEVEYIEGVVKLEDGMTLIHDLDSFLSLEEERELDEAMKEGLEEVR